MDQLTSKLSDNQAALDPLLGVGRSYDVIARDLRIGSRRGRLYVIDGYGDDGVIERICSFLLGPGARWAEEAEDMQALGALLRENGWTWLTALNAILFSLMHWPCSTTLITIARETRSARWTLAGALLPTLLGAAVCALTTGVARALGLAV